MDVLNTAILRILQKNARISNKDIAEMVHVTPPVITSRIKKMEEKNIIIGYRCVVNAKELGKALMARINIKATSEKREKLVEALSKSEKVVSYEHVTGSYSMSIKVLTKDMKELEVMISKLQKFGTTETLLILSNNMADELIYTLD
jgi:Lrp/AsnC family transcriptional regulator, leucine-responsive regulatory protein